MPDAQKESEDQIAKDLCRETLKLNSHVFNSHLTEKIEDGLEILKNQIRTCMFSGRRMSEGKDMAPDAINRILLASCRTIQGGDSYFQIRTMFISPNIVMTPAKDMSSDERLKAVTEIAVQPESAVVTTTNFYDVIFMNEIGSPSTDKKDRLRIETVITEIIDLRQLPSEDISRRVLSVNMPHVNLYKDIIDLM